MGRRKEIKEVGWNDPTNRTIYRWKVGQITRSTAWTNTVRNRFRQKAGEIETSRALEIGAAKWCKEHIPRKGNNLHDITAEGISLLDDAELWWEKQNHTNTGQFPQPLQVTGTYGRARVETRWGSG